MANGCCNSRRDCTLWALIVSLIIGIVAAFLQITAVVTLPAAALVGAFVLAVVYLATILVVSVLLRAQFEWECLGHAVNAVLAGILVTALTAATLLVIPFAATSIAGAIITGILAAAVSLTLTATACLVRCLTGCPG